MSKMWVLLLLGGVFFGETLQAQPAPGAPPKKRVRVVYYHYPPHLIVTKDGITGASVEVWNRVAKRGDLELEWVGPIPFMRAQWMLENGEVDAIARLAATPDRRKKFVYTEKAPIWGAQGIAVLKTEPLNALRTPEDLKNKTLGMISGGILPAFVKDNLHLVSLEPIPIDTVHLNMQKLFKKRIWGVYFIFTDVAKYYAAKEHQEDKIKFLTYPGSEGFAKAYMAISRKSDPDLIRRLSSAINAEVGTYDYPKISQKYIDQAAKGLIQEIDSEN